MEQPAYLFFGPFRLDPGRRRLWRGEEALKLRPTAVAVLYALAEHAGQVLSKEDLLRRVWAGTCVTKTVLKVCIREIREALGDKATTPHYIETVGRQGYRFVGPPTTGKTALTAASDDVGGEPIVGREREVEQLQRWLAKARRGLRQLVFVTGEPGIGKTTLVDLFLTASRSNGQARIGRGRCVEQYGEGEAYLPILEALSRLCREPGGARFITVLKQYAPTWLVQMPALLGDAELSSLQQKGQGTTRQRMLHEIAEAVEALTVESPLILVFEDLHWSDYSTLELISYLAQRQEPARLMVIGTYRPTDLARGHPLKGITQELRVRGQCEELPLKLLTAKDVAVYLARRFPEMTIPAELARIIHRRTDGNALFLINVVNSLMSQGLLVERNGPRSLRIATADLRVPDTLRQLIEHRFERLSPEEQHVLAAASVAGSEFTSATVAAAVSNDVIEIEEVCAELVRRKQFIQGGGTSEWPDGTVSARYNFIHALYQEVLHDRVTVRKRVQLHQQSGERLEQGYGDRSQEIAAELAVHFAQGRDCRRAVHYLRQAAENATQRCAYHEAISHLTKALELLNTLPNTAQREQQELLLQATLGPALIAAKGFAAAEVKEAYARARELCLQMGETPQLFPVLRGLAAFYSARADLQTAHDLAEQCLSLAQRQQDPLLLLAAHFELGTALHCEGDFAQALRHFEQGLTFYDPKQHDAHAFLYGQDLRVSCLSRLAFALWFLGYPDQALEKSQEALALARQQPHPFSLAYALSFAAECHRLRQEGGETLDLTEAVIILSTKQSFPVWAAGATILQGWALAEQGRVEEGMAQLHKGLATWQAIGVEQGRSCWLALLAELHERMGQSEKGLTVLTEALATAHKNGERWWGAELFRLKGELLLKAKVPRSKSKISPLRSHVSDLQAEAVACFQQALDIARHQRAKSLELRAAVSLGRLWQQQGKRAEARQLVAETYSWFTEGFDTKDLQEAKALLVELQVDVGSQERSIPNEHRLPLKHSVAS